MIFDILVYFKSVILPQGLVTAFKLWPIWLPLIALILAFEQWLNYKQREWIKAQETTLLEVRLPTEQVKSPVSMEIFLQTLAQSGVGSLTDVYLKGRVRPTFSLELVSNGGQVHLYIWLQAKFRQLVEANLYAQFPTVEIHQVPDYAKEINYDLGKYSFGKFAHLVLTKPDAYPIKTYIDYGLKDDPDEEYKVDPLATVLEFLGSLKPGEHAWIQILLQAHTKEGLKYGRLVTKPDWKGAAGEEIKKVLKEARLKGDDVPDKYDPKYLTETQKDVVKAIERSLEKTAFDAMIRVAYFAETASFNANNIGGVLGVLKQFSSQTLNGLKPSGYDFDYPWQDFNNLRKNKTNREFLEAYKRRAIFNKPFKHFHHDKPYILTTEEVATLFHFPSAIVAATPTLNRVPSKKAEAPANLPV